MTNSNNVNNVVKMLPTNTKQLRFNVSDGGTIGNYSFTELTDMKQNDITACNILITALLTEFGIDIRSIARISPDITSTTPVVVDIQNLLINAKWEDTELTIDGVTKTAIEWIKYRFQIYNKTDFITNLYRRLNDFIMSSPCKDETVLATIDEEAYLMVKLIALCFGADITFMSVQVGEQTGINIPFDPSNIRNVEEAIYDVLVEKGLISSSISKASFSLSTDIHHMFEDSPLNSDNFFKYAHFSYIQCPNGAWMACIYFTGEEISTINFIGTFYYVWHGGSVVEALYTAIPIDKNGTPISDDNLMGTWQKIGPTQYAFAPNLNEYDVFSGAMESRGACFCKRTNCDLIVGENTVHYDVVRYDSTQGSNHYINTDIPAHWWHMPYGCSGDASLQITSRYFARSNKQSGDNVTWSTQGNPQYPWQGLPTTLPSEFTDDSVKHDVILNNVLLGEIVTVPSPTTDDSIYDEINHIDMLDLLKKFIIKIDWDSIDWLIKDKTTPYDIDNILNTRIIDVNRGVNLRTGEPITNMKEDLTTEYSSTFSSKVDYYNGAKNLCKSPFEYYTVFISDYEMQTFSDAIWDKDIWDKIKDDFQGFTLLDCVKSLIMLPFKLRDPDDYDLTRNPISFAGKILDDDLKGHELKTFVKVLNTYPIAIGGEVVDDEYISGGQFTKKFSKDPDSYLNYEPYSQASIYIPFVGERDLQLSLIWHKMVYLEYIVFVPTGDFVANVLAYDYSDNCKLWDDYMGTASMQKGYPVLTCTGNMAIKFPLAGREQANVIGGMSGALTGVLGGVANIASGNVANGISHIIGGASGMLTSLNGGTRVNGSSMDTNFAYLNNLSPYITLYGHECIKGYKDSGEASAFNQTIGMKAERGIKIGNMGSGFHKVKGIKIDGLKCTDKEKEMIEQILTNGFYYAGSNDSYEQPED